MPPKKTGRSLKATPYYEQVANVLRAQITSRESDRPIRLPTEVELCAIHHVSRITIRRALSLLESEGLVQRARGRGTLTVPAAIRQWQRRRQSRVIHVLTDWQRLAEDPANFYGQIYQGILSRCEQAGYRLSTQPLQIHRADIAFNPVMPDPQSTFGVIFVGLMNEPTIQLYTQAGYCVVAVDFWTRNPRADAIVVDCYTEGQDAVEFLLRQGHRDLFYVGNALTYDPTGSKEPDAILMLSGINHALERADLAPLPPERACFCNSDPGRAQQIVDWFLALKPRPTAGVIFNARTCQLFLDRLRQRNMRSPEDVSIMTKLWEGEPREVTSMRSDARLLGELAVDALLDRGSGRRSAALRLALPSRLDRGRTVRQLMPAAPQPPR
jgi:DNA-binding LacI/PurR family transcriptional regulator